MADKDWGIVNSVVSAVASSGLVKLARLGGGPRPEDLPVAQLPACFVSVLGTDEFPLAGDDEVFCVVRFKLVLVVKGQDEAARVESAMKLANDVKDALMVDRFRAGLAAFGPAQKPTEFAAGAVSPGASHPFTAYEIDGSCGFYASEIAR